MRSAPEVEVGTTWFAWGEHWLVKAERVGRDLILDREGGKVHREREVHLEPRDPKRARDYRRHPRWVADWRVAKFGALSALNGT